MCCVYDGLEPYNHYEPQQDTNNPIPRKGKCNAEVCNIAFSGEWNLCSHSNICVHRTNLYSRQTATGLCFDLGTRGAKGCGEGHFVTVAKGSVRLS
jgi:hypothetical protein